MTCSRLVDGEPCLKLPHHQGACESHMPRHVFVYIGQHPVLGEYESPRPAIEVENRRAQWERGDL